MKSILLYESAVSRSAFREAIILTLDSPNLIGISDFRGQSDFWFGDYLYNARYDKGTSLPPDFEAEVIRRDRALRDMPLERASKIVRRIWNGVNSLFDIHDFDYLITTGVDRCSVHILTTVAEMREIPYASPLGSFITGYAWFTRHGERNVIRNNVSNEEIDYVLSLLLRSDFLPSYEKTVKTYNQWEIKKWHIRRWLIENFFYPIKKTIERDSDNVFYSMSYLCGNGIFSLIGSDIEQYFERITALRIDRSNAVYLPLHMSPEATTDYWCDRIVLTGYEQYIINMINASDDSVHFFVKEHPSMYKYGKRSKSFYPTLSAMENVTLVHPLDNSNEMLEAVDNVLVSVGTVGVEALLRGKRVLSLEKSYYSGLHPNIKPIDYVTEDILHCEIQPYDNRQFVRDLLMGMFPSDYVNNRTQINCSRTELAAGFALLFKSWDW